MELEQVEFKDLNIGREFVQYEGGKIFVKTAPGWYERKEGGGPYTAADHQKVLVVPIEPTSEGKTYLEDIVNRLPSAKPLRFWAEPEPEPQDPRHVASITNKTYRVAHYSDGTATLEGCYKKNPEFPGLTIMGDGTLQSPFTIVKIGG